MSSPFITGSTFMASKKGAFRPAQYISKPTSLP
jgi:hypothetical protein